jgi:type II secretory pathway pseudopilin PulG
MEKKRMFLSSPWLSTKGITLVEVLVSMALVTLVIVSVVALLGQSATYSVRIDKIYTTANLAKKRIDDIKWLQFTDLAARAAEVNVRIDEAGYNDPNGGYIRTTEITENFDGNVYLTKIKVTVDEFTDGAALGKPTIVETLRADHSGV